MLSSTPSLLSELHYCTAQSIIEGEKRSEVHPKRESKYSNKLLCNMSPNCWLDVTKCDIVQDGSNISCNSVASVVQ